MSDPVREAVYNYHQRTKHRLERYAAGPEFLDWDDQPAPFRSFSGAHSVPLPLLAGCFTVSWRALMEGDVSPLPLDLPHIAVLFELSLGLAVWKHHGGNRWALRCTPSSGNLHPTEGYLIARGIEGVADGVHHYSPDRHALEQRCRFPADPEAASSPQLFIGLSSILWREAWKYGERAFRYCQLDLGHALGALRYAAALLGWQMRLIDLDDPQLAGLLGLDRADDFAGAEPEHPDLLLQVGPSDGVSALVARGEWQGRASRLGGEPRLRWPVIGEVAAATRQHLPWPGRPMASAPPHAPLHCRCDEAVVSLIRRRRSAQRMDGVEVMGHSAFLQLLDTLLPRPGRLPWDLWPYRARIHLVLLVHRVEGIAPGLYLLPRHPGAEIGLLERMKGEFDGEQVTCGVEGFPLFHLAAGNAQPLARTLSCHQGIAADSCFAVVMLADFDETLGEGAGEYRRLHWEAGLVGQQLYLGAESHGLQGTGIGCFFDDSVHELLGLEDTRYQVLYHFTVGRALPDPRIQSDPPYGVSSDAAGSASIEGEEGLAALRRQIGELWREREGLKGRLTGATERVARRGLWKELEGIDGRLSQLDSEFKMMWDRWRSGQEGGDEAGGGR